MVVTVKPDFAGVHNISEHFLSVADLLPTCLHSRQFPLGKSVWRAGLSAIGKHGEPGIGDLMFFPQCEDVGKPDVMIKLGLVLSIVTGDRFYLSGRVRGGEIIDLYNRGVDDRYCRTGL